VRSVLAISSTRRFDTASFRCVAVNAYGRGTKRIDLVVQVSLSFITADDT